MHPMPLLQVDGLEHELRDPDSGSVFTLRVNHPLKVCAGSFTTILGESACGKTTLLTLLGLIRKPSKPVTGEFQIGGKSIANLWSRGRRRDIENLRRQYIGFALQSGELLEALTVSENIAVPMRLNGASIKESDQRVASLLKAFSIDNARAHARVNELSGGEYQRVALARSIAHSPEIVFVDEPTAALDRKNAQESLKFMSSSVWQKQSVVMITHNEELASAFATQKVEMGAVTLPTGGRGGTIVKIAPNSPTIKSVGIPSEELTAMPSRGKKLFGKYRRAWYYVCLAWFDISRLRSSVWRQVLIVLWICLPILLLQGLKNGHIKELQKAFTESPTGREIQIFPGDCDPITSLRMSQLQAEIPNIKVLIPDIFRIISLSTEQEQLDSVTLFSTKPGDPRLEKYDIFLEEYKDGTVPQIVVTQMVADALAIKEGEKVLLHVTRELKDGKNEPAKAEVQIAHVIPLDDAEKTVGGTAKEKEVFAHAPFGLLLDLERYVKGQEVERFYWESSDPPPQDTYAGYLIFTEKQSPLLSHDIEALNKRNYLVREINGDTFTQTLGGILKETACADLTVYHLYLKGRENDDWGELPEPSTLSMKIENLTDTDVIVVAWNKPKKMSINGSDFLVVGVAPPQYWLRNYLSQSNAFTDNGDVYSILSLNNDFTEKYAVLVSQNDPIQLEVFNADITVKPSSENSKEKIVFIPSKMLAYLYAHQNGAAVAVSDPHYPHRKILAQRPVEPSFTIFRAYTETIDEVPETVEQLKKQGFGVLSNAAQIDEIRKQRQSLDILVSFVTVGAFLCGVFIICSILWDSTEKKLRTIGILRVMGVSERGVFAMILFRSIIIGMPAVLITALIGLVWKIPNIDYYSPIHIAFDPFDIILVSIGVLICCCVGALLPAFSAKSMNPFDAISKGKFR